MGKKALFLILGLYALLGLLAVPAQAGGVRVSAAASLKEAFNEIAAIYLKRAPDVKIIGNYGASGMLAQQIESGAPADIFISANVEWIDHLKRKGMLAGGSVRPFAFNELVFVGDPKTKAGSLQDLAALKRIAVGSPKSVPAGTYALEVLKKAGLDRQLEKRLVFAKDVRECLMYAERGDVDGAFVYRTDALLAKKASIRFAVTGSDLPRIVYPGAITLGGARNTDAVAFFRFLQTGPVKAVLAKYGFSAN